MAISAGIAWEVRTGGNDTNGGGFLTGASGTDYSQQNSKNSGGNDSSTTDAVTAASSTVTSATANFQTTIVGNLIYLAGGTGSLTGAWYEVKTRVTSTSITVDRNPGASSGVTMNIGGALASPGQAGANKVAGNAIYIASGTYTISTSGTNVATGCVNDTTGGVSGDGTQNSFWQGYGSAREDLGTAPVLKIAASGVSSVTVIKATGGGLDFTNIKVDGSSKTSIVGFDLSGANYQNGILLIAINCTSYGIRGGGRGYLWRCAASGGSGTYGIDIGTAASSAIDCEAFSNTCTGFYWGAAQSNALIRCLSYANSGGSSYGFTGYGQGIFIANCVAYNNGSHGFYCQGSVSQSYAFVFKNCIAETNGGYAYFGDNKFRGGWLFFCAAYNNTSGRTHNINRDITAIDGSGSFFVNAGAGNFALNNTASAGALCRATGFPGTMPAGTSVGYLDVGAIQHQDPASGTTTNIFILDD
jgi:hypothetical protein